MSFTFEYRGIEVEAEVEGCRDAYGTGDSPTLYDVDIISAWDIEDDREIDLNKVSSQFYDELCDEAIQEYIG